jgi:hypothetical protein
MIQVPFAYCRSMVEWLMWLPRLWKLTYAHPPTHKYPWTVSSACPGPYSRVTKVNACAAVRHRADATDELRLLDVDGVADDAVVEVDGVGGVVLTDGVGLTLGPAGAACLVV